MGNNNNETLEKALQNVLTSLAQAYLSLGKAYPEYDAESRSAFVRVVSGQPGAHQTEPLPDGAIAFLTGLDAGEVNRLRGDGAPDAPTSAATLLIELWLAEASDSEGHANPLPLEGPQSFESLLARAGWTGQDPEEALAALVSIGLAELRNELVYLNDDALPGADDVEEAAALCAGAFPLLAAIGERREARRPFIESRKLGDVREADVSRVRRIAASELRQAQARVEALLGAYDVLGDDDDDRLSVSSGVYFVAGESFSRA